MLPLNFGVRTKGRKQVSSFKAHEMLASIITMMIMMMHPILLFFFILSLFLCFKSLGSLLCFPFFFLFQISGIFRRSLKLFLRLSTKEFPLVSYLTFFTIHMMKCHKKLQMKYIKNYK